MNTRNSECTVRVERGQSKLTIFNSNNKNRGLWTVYPTKRHTDKWNTWRPLSTHRKGKTSWWVPASHVDTVSRLLSCQQGGPTGKYKHSATTVRRRDHWLERTGHRILFKSNGSAQKLHINGTWSQNPALFCEYSQLSPKRTPSGPKLLSGLERCPL